MQKVFLGLAGFIVLLTGCSSLEEVPTQLNAQRLAEPCSQNSQVFASESAGRVVADASVRCVIARDGYDEVRLFVGVQRFVNGGWVNVGSVGQSARKGPPPGGSVVLHEHIKGYALCETGRYRPRLTTTWYQNGTNIVRGSGTGYGPERIIDRSGCS